MSDSALREKIAVVLIDFGHLESEWQLHGDKESHPRPDPEGFADRVLALLDQGSESRGAPSALRIARERAAAIFAPLSEPSEGERRPIGWAARIMFGAEEAITVFPTQERARSFMEGWASAPKTSGGEVFEVFRISEAEGERRQPRISEEGLRFSQRWALKVLAAYIMERDRETTMLPVTEALEIATRAEGSPPPAFGWNRKPPEDLGTIDFNDGMDAGEIAPTSGPATDAQIVQALRRIAPAVLVDGWDGRAIIRDAADRLESLTAEGRAPAVEPDPAPRMVLESEWMHGTEIICDQCSMAWSGPIAGGKAAFLTCPACLRSALDASTAENAMLRARIVELEKELQQRNWDFEDQP